MSDVGIYPTFKAKRHYGSQIVNRSDTLEDLNTETPDDCRRSIEHGSQSPDFTIVCRPSAV
jgi:hypothetical protein